MEEHYKESRDVIFYAAKLFMTTRNLNFICQDILHQSVSEIIENRKLTEASIARPIIFSSYEKYVS